MWREASRHRIIILIPSVITAFLDRAKECGVRRRAKARYRTIGPALRARNRAHRRRLAEEKENTMARFECQSDLDSAPKPRGREERGDRERMNLGMSGKRMFTNMLKSAVGTVNDRPCIPPEGLNRDMLKTRPSSAPVPQFTTRTEGNATGTSEEAIYKIRKSLLKAEDALSELADELFPHGGAQEKDEGKKEDKEAQSCTSTWKRNAMKEKSNFAIRPSKQLSKIVEIVPDHKEWTGKLLYLLH
ncbi:hypothetical protein niasHT_025647 [Heterodera trifolii]|uniref:Uncharacterized protein n=1 Tax=Heterodera trifolii TaxID=157864 RepID=A0ABD2KHR3_9BILA